jgi:hypothetical protein
MIKKLLLASVMILAAGSLHAKVGADMTLMKKHYGEDITELDKVDIATGQKILSFKKESMTITAVMQDGVCLRVDYEATGETLERDVQADLIKINMKDQEVVRISKFSREELHKKFEMQYLEQKRVVLKESRMVQKEFRKTATETKRNILEQGKKTYIGDNLSLADC